ncbi:MAG: hypothetical protein KFF73_12360 [Cyclobacteriaceae bacterium]|nr:hypothetical protein [Cyclobacteriaceae bacterium]
MILKLYSLLMGTMLLSGGCYQSPFSGLEEEIKPGTHEPVYDYYSLKTTDAYDSTGMPLGKVSQHEISGISLSRPCPNRIWAIDDSGNGPYLYLFDAETAQTRCVYYLGNLQNIDWEEMSSIQGPGEEPGLLIGDIGNNSRNRKVLTLYRLKEPACDCDSDKEIEISAAFEKIDFVYPAGTHDAEAMFVDDETGDIYIIAKDQPRSGVYRLSYPQDTEKTDTLTYLGSLPFPLVVSADYMPDENKLIVKTYDQIFLWENVENKNVSELIFDIPLNAPYNPPELQGESIAIAGEGYYTLSEKVFLWEPVLYFYKKK